MCNAFALAFWNFHATFLGGWSGNAQVIFEPLRAREGCQATYTDFQPSEPLFETSTPSCLLRVWLWAKVLIGECVSG